MVLRRDGYMAARQTISILTGSITRSSGFRWAKPTDNGFVINVEPEPANRSYASHCGHVDHYYGGIHGSQHHAAAWRLRLLSRLGYRFGVGRRRHRLRRR